MALVYWAQLRSSRIPREQLTEVAHVKGTVREYLADLEQENPTSLRSLVTP
ncbi:MAG: hypothetical protein WBQ04_16555 [Candidatus Acidiferrales bacterium]